MSCVHGPPRYWNSAKWKRPNKYIPRLALLFLPGIKEPTKKLPVSGKISPSGTIFFIDIYVN